MTETTSAWSKRVEAWRASGERAEDFSRREGYAASTLRWWASKLKREAPRRPEVRLARVVRTPSPTVTAAPARAGMILVDVVHAGVRVAVEAGADRATLAMVLDVLGVGARP